MTYKVTRDFKYRLKNQFFSNCIEMKVLAKHFMNTRSGPIQVDIIQKFYVIISVSLSKQIGNIKRWLLGTWS